MYTAIDLDTKLILGVDLFGSHGTDPAAMFLHGLSEKHDLSEAVFLVDTASQAVVDVHCMTEKRHDTRLGWHLADDKGYDWQLLCDRLREEGVRPLIKHHDFGPIDHAHNARIDRTLYGQRALSETVFSVIKRTPGNAVRARV